MPLVGSPRGPCRAGLAQGSNFACGGPWHRSCSLYSLRSGSQPYKGRAGNSGAPDGAGTPPRLYFTSSSLLRARPGERGLDDFSKALDREGADQGPPVDQKARRGPEPELACLCHIRVDGAGELAAVQAPGERARVDPEVGRVPDQFRALERGLRRVEAVVVRPVLPRGPGAACRLVRAAGELVPGEREVLHDQADPARVLPQELVQRPLDPPAVRSLVVGELDDRDRRVGRAADHGRVDGDLDLRRGGGGGAGGEQGEAERGRAEASPPAQAARPSSERAVMM